MSGYINGSKVDMKLSREIEETNAEQREEEGKGSTQHTSYLEESVFTWFLITYKEYIQEKHFAFCLVL